jgi:hypothetical protein
MEHFFHATTFSCPYEWTHLSYNILNWDTCAIESYFEYLYKHAANKVKYTINGTYFLYGVVELGKPFQGNVGEI